MTEKRINEIEMTLAHQDQQIQDMSELINSQWKEIERLKSKLKKMESRVGEIEDAGEGDQMSSIEAAAMEKPPHY